jgi:cytidine deaminase
MTNAELIEKARSVVRPHRLGIHTTGDVGCALIDGEGKLHLGVCIDVSCGIGFCAEHAAIASMATSGQYRIRQIVAVLADGKVVPPCGRCREFIYQLDPANVDTRVILPDGEKPLRELLPHPWK